MRLFALALAVVAGAAACPGPPAELCGQSTAAVGDADVDEGFGSADRSDGVAFREAGDWAPAPSSSVVIGTLSMVMQFDEAGLVVDDLVADGAFPICIPQGARSETSGAANLVDGGFVTDATHTGGLVLLAKEGDVLVGRFGFDMVAGAETLTFENGVFRVAQRN